MLDDYTRYQQKIIKGYYRNFEAIQVQKLSELCTDLYLAEGAKKKETLWKRAEEIMVKMEVPADRIRHLLEKKDPKLVAVLVKELLGS